jgi:hypothetical protein
MSDAQVACVEGKLERGGIAVAIPRIAHRTFSPTCGSKNTAARINSDASSPENMKAAVDRDTAAMQKNINPECAKAYKAAAKKIKEHDNEGLIKKSIKDCCS